MTAILLQLFWTFFIIGLFNFGGGGAMISLIQNKVVSEFGWITQAQFTDIVAISQSTPGPIGINCATYVGYEVGHSLAAGATGAAGSLSTGAIGAASTAGAAGTAGATGATGSAMLGIAGSALATFALVLPSFIIFWGIMVIYRKYHRTALFGNVMSGLRPVVAGLIGAAALVLMFRFGGGISSPGTGWSIANLQVSVIRENFGDWTSWAILAGTLASSLFLKANPILLIIAGGILGLLIY